MADVQDSDELALAGLGPPVDVYETASCRAASWVQQGRVFLCRARGSVTVETSAWANAVCDRILERHDRLYLFNDWSGVTHYESACRITMTKWAVVHFRHIVAGHYYVGASPLLTMSVELAAMVLRGLHLHTEQAPFLQAFHDTCAYVRRKDAVGA